MSGVVLQFVLCGVGVFLCHRFRIGCSCFCGLVCLCVFLVFLVCCCVVVF